MYPTSDLPVLTRYTMLLSIPYLYKSKFGLSIDNHQSYTISARRVEGDENQKIAKTTVQRERVKIKFLTRTLINRSVVQFFLKIQNLDYL